MLYGHVIIHELMHVLVARFLGVEYHKIQIGANLLSINITSKLIVSLIPIGGYVEVDRKCLINQTNIKIFMFFEIAPFFNLIISIVSCYYVKGIYGFFLCVIGFFIFIASQAMPAQSDLGGMCRLMYEKKKFTNKNQ